MGLRVVNVDEPADLEELALSAAMQVAPLFALHGWAWHIAPGEPLRVPTEAEIAETFRTLLRIVDLGFEGVTRTGRLLVIVQRDPDGGSREVRACLDLAELFPDGA